MTDNNSLDNEQQDTDTNKDSASESSMSVIDTYINTGVYVEDGTENGDILIVLGSNILDQNIRQFYITLDNKFYTRLCTEDKWSSWFIVQPQTVSDETISFNNYNDAGCYTIENADTFSYAPMDFHPKDISKPVTLLCISVKEEHLIQFIIAKQERRFWVRHKSIETWSDWTSFI